MVFPDKLSSSFFQVITVGLRQRVIRSSSLFGAILLVLGFGGLMGIPVAIAAPNAPLLSQASPPPQSMQSGTQVVLNDRTLPATWSQWQSGNSLRTGISDGSLMQITGLELLDTQDATRQPIQWFSQLTNPLSLPTRLTGPLRFLDITELARQSGWQVQASGATLRITTPAARVLAIRQGKQPWGDRLVLELDRPAPWQVDQQTQELSLTLQAQIDPAVIQAFQPRLGEPVKSFKIEAVQNQTIVRLGIPLSLRPHIWSLPAPNRLIVDVRADSLTDRDIIWAPGLRWRRQTLTVGNDRFPVTWLDVDPRQPGLRILPILPNSAALAGIAPLAQTARQAQVSAAINGGFFNRNNQLPLGAIRLDGRWLSGPILNRGAIGWNPGGDLRIDRLTLQEALITSTGQRLPLAYLNSAYPGVGIARYTPAWGPTYAPLTDNEIILTVQGDRATEQQTIATPADRPIPIPNNGYLLALRASPTLVPVLPVGTTLKLETSTTPPEFSRYAQIIAAGPLLLQNRQIVLDAAAEKFSPAFGVERASRSAIGQTAGGNLLIVAVHHRINGAGASLTEIAQIMQRLGAINALNLDGGSSTTLYLGGQVIDRLPRTAARVHNGIGIFISPKGAALLR